MPECNETVWRPGYALLGTPAGFIRRGPKREEREGRREKRVKGAEDEDKDENKDDGGWMNTPIYEA